MSAEFTQVPTKDLAVLLDRVKAYEAKEDQIAEACYSALKVIGLVDEKTGEVIPELKGDGKGVVSIIIRKVKDSFSVSDFMFRREKAEADLAAKFSFLKKLLPIFEDYARRKKYTGASA